MIMKFVLNRWAGVVGLALFLALISGCAGVTPKSNFYRLELPAGPLGRLDAPETLSVGIGPVMLPAYLERAEVVTAAGEAGIQINEFHRWAAPLNRQIRESLMEQLSALLDTPRVVLYPWERYQRPRFRVDVTFTRFEQQGTHAVVEALWHIKDVEMDRTCLARRFSRSVAAGGHGVGAYVAAQGRAMEVLARQIATGLVGMASGCQTPGQ